MKAWFFIPVALMVLTACKADRVRVDLNEESIVSAAAGQPGKVGFFALIEEKHTKIDDEKRALIKSVEASISKFFKGSEVDVSIEVDGYTIEVEGELDIAAAFSQGATPWYVSVRPADGFPDGLLVSLEPGSTFDSFSKEIRDIEFMFAPDRFQPVEFRLRAEDAEIIVGGAVLNGEPVSLKSVKLSSNRATLSFSDGIWDNVAPGFVFKPKE